MSKRAFVSVLIPTKDRKDMLERCINSVLRSSYKNFEIIVSDDSESDDTERLVRKIRKHFNKIYYIKNSENSIARAMNRAILKSRGEYLVLLDDDNAVDKKFLGELLIPFEKDTSIGIVGPLALYYSRKDIVMHAGTIRSPFMRRAINVHENEVWKMQIIEGENVDDFANSFMFSREAVKRAGLYDELVPLMGDDGDMEARIRKAGYSVVINPKAKTYHDIPYVPGRKYFLRVTDARMYHVLHSKLLYVARYDTVIGKVTFSISIPVYLFYYIVAIFRQNITVKKKLHMIRRLFSGTLDGIIDMAKGKNSIVYLR